MQIERIGSTNLPGVRAIEWHGAPEPDGHFLRLPMPDVVLTINVGVVGQYRQRGIAESSSGWLSFARIALRGICAAPSEGRDPPTGAVAYLSVVIEPWAVPGYLRATPAAFANCIVDAEMLCGELGQLSTALANAALPAERLAHAHAWLKRRWDAARISPMQRDVLDGLRLGAEVSAVARHLHLSTRRVHQLCRIATGHPPSTYHRIARFARAIHDMHHRPSPTSRWSDCVHGYADHSHAIRSFRRLATVTPRAYAAARSRQVRSWSIVPLDDAADRAAQGD